MGRGITKSFGSGRARRVILDGVDVTLERGELVAVVGRSGTGKSTLLHVLGGLDRADAGRIVVGGARVDGRSERELSRIRRSTMGFVFQFFHLLPELSGEANVLLPARLTRQPEATKRAYELIERLGVLHVRHSMPHELSGGEQQRFAIARALVNDPPVVFADEPIGNLDERSGAGVLQLLRELASDDGRAVLMVTHQPEATAIADRVLRLEDGRLEST